jgi:hypothetical protein
MPNYTRYNINVSNAGDEVMKYVTSYSRNGILTDNVNSASTDRHLGEGIIYSFLTTEMELKVCNEVYELGCKLNN